MMTVVDNQFSGVTAPRPKGSKVADAVLADAMDAKSAFDDAFADAGKKKRSTPDDKGKASGTAPSADEKQAHPGKTASTMRPKPPADEDRLLTLLDPEKPAVQVETKPVPAEKPPSRNTGKDVKPEEMMEAPETIDVKGDTPHRASPLPTVKAQTQTERKPEETSAATKSAASAETVVPAVDINQLLSLLVSQQATTTPANQNEEQPDLNPVVTAFQKLAERAGQGSVAHSDAVTNNETPPAETDDVTAQDDKTFRFARADGKGRDVSMTIGADGKVSVDGGDKATARAETVTVLEARRYLGLPANSNAAAITSAISAAAGQPSAAALTPAAGSAETAAEAANGKVLNTLKIQMHPIELGLVTATLRLKDDELHVHLKVESGDAFRQLSDDQNEMVKALRMQGFAVDQITVTFNAPDSATSNTTPQAQTQTSAQGRDGFSDGAQQGRGQRGNDNAGRQGRDGIWTGTEAIADPSVTGDPRGAGDLYM